MAITYTWEITRLEIVDTDGLQNVAVQACFDVSGVDEEDRRGFAQSDVRLGAPNPNDFTDINNTTHEQALQWVKNALGPDGVSRFEKMVESQIESLKVPRPKAVELDWIKKTV